MAQSSDQAVAQTLFDLGMKLMGEGKYAEACPKLAESQRLDPGGGTLINLGLCREKEGKLGSAWASFNDALSIAVRDGRADREKIAREHIAAIEPNLQKIVISVSKEAATTPGLEIKYDGTPIRSAAWGLPTPTDEGLHAVTATAPGKITWHWELEVKAGAAPDAVMVPALENVSAPPPVKRSPWPWIIGGVGVAGLGVGLAAGVVAIAKHSDANTLCGGDPCQSQRGIDAENTANGAAWAANIALVAGAVTVGVAIVLFVVRSGKAEPPAAATANGLKLAF
jgi:hypothetical protein